MSLKQRLSEVVPRPDGTVGWTTREGKMVVAVLEYEDCRKLLEVINCLELALGNDISWKRSDGSLVLDHERRSIVALKSVEEDE